MINWTNISELVEASWKSDGKFDLPVPESGYECMELIHKVEDLQGLFNYGDDSLADEYELISEEAVDLLEELTPRDISITDYPASWEDQVKLWLFRIAVYNSVRASSEVRSDHLKNVCSEYLERLKNRFQELMNEEYDE